MSNKAVGLDPLENAKVAGGARGYSSRLSGLGVQLGSTSSNLGSSSQITFSSALLHPRVQAVAAERFNSKHYADAVEAAFKALDGEVRVIAMSRGAPEMDGADLMHTVFSPNRPFIALADLTTKSGRNLQQGYMEMFAGSMMALRNPKAHANLDISAERAMHHLFVASDLWGALDARV